MKRCIYCDTEKEDSEFSDEHVIPQAIGGALTPVNPFLTGDVCGQCNNTCGLFIDTAFIKNWFTQVGRAREAMRHLRLNDDSIVPLTYMGIASDLQNEDRICELWLGPAGDSIYHFHQPYPELADMPAIVGVAPNLRAKADPGFAFIYLVPTNRAWWLPILRSFAKQFSGSKLYWGNGPTPAGGKFSDVPPELTELKTRIEAKAGQPHPTGFSISVNYGARFLAKLALGLGHIFLRPSFARSDAANLLRKLMWERNSDAREEIPVHGSDFLNTGNAAAFEMLSWPGGHVVALLPDGDGLILFVRFYDHQRALIRITNDRAHWDGFLNPEGAVFAFSPGLQRVVGPKTLPAFLAHRQGVHIDPELQALAVEMQSVPPVPPFHLSKTD